eukprot:gene10537-7494_t
MDFSDESLTAEWTTDQITRAHIQRLQHALRNSTSEAVDAKEEATRLSAEVARLQTELLSLRRRDRTKAAELALSERFSMSPEDPQSLLCEVARFLPQYETGRWVVACAARASENWIFVSTESRTQEELVFGSHTFDNFLRYRQNDRLKDSGGVEAKGVVEVLSDVLPAEIVHFLFTGDLPSQAMESAIFREDVREGIYPYQYHENAGFPSCGVVLDEFADRRCVVFVAFVCDDAQLRQHPAAVAAEESSVHEALSRLLLGATEASARDSVDWLAVMEHACRLFLAAVVKSLEFREADQHRFRGALLTALDQTLATGSSCEALLLAVSGLLQREVSALDDADDDAASSGALRSAPRWEARCELVAASPVIAEVALSLHGVAPGQRLLWLPTDAVATRAAPRRFASDHDALCDAVATSLATRRTALRSFSRLSPLAPFAEDGASSGAREKEARLQRDEVAFVALPLGRAAADHDAAAGGLQLLWLLRLSASSVVRSGAAVGERDLFRPVGVSSSFLQRVAAAMGHGDVAQLLWSWLARSHFAQLSVFRPAGRHGDDDEADDAALDEVAAAERLQSLVAHGAVSQSDARRVARFVGRATSSDFAVVLHVPAAAAAQPDDAQLRWISDGGELRCERLAALPPALRLLAAHVAAQATGQRARGADALETQWTALSGDVWLLSDCLRGARKALLALLALDERGAAQAAVVGLLDSLLDRPALVDRALDVQALCLSLGADDGRGAVCVLHGRLLRRLPTAAAERAHEPLLRLCGRLAALLAAQRQSQQLRLQQLAIAALERSRERTESFRRGLHALARSVRDAGAGVAASGALAVRDVRRVLCDVVSRYVAEELADAAAVHHRSDVRCACVLRQSLHRLRGDEAEAASEAQWRLAGVDCDWQPLDGAAAAGDALRRSVRVHVEAPPRVLAATFPQLVVSVDVALTGAAPAALGDVWQRFEASLSFAIWRDELDRFVAQHRALVLQRRAAADVAAAQADGDDAFFRVALQALNAAMLSKSRGARDASQLARPYHLHDYLHDAALLRRVSCAPAAEPFLLLPLRARELRVLPAQELPLPRRVNRAVAAATTAALDDAGGPQQPMQRLHRSAASQLTVLPQAAKALLHYLGDLDAQLGAALLPLLFGAQAALVDAGGGGGGADDDERRGFAERALSAEQSVVLLYSPLYPAAAARRGQQAPQFWAQPWATHYLVVTRRDRVASLSSALALQRLLDAVFRPSQTVATGQSWFECVSGMERLLLASTSLAALLKRDVRRGRGAADARGGSQLRLFQLDEAGGAQLHAQASQAERHRAMVKRLISRRSFMHLEAAEATDDTRVTSAGFVSEHFFAEATNVLAECLSIAKAAIGAERYVAAAGYLLAPQELQQFVLQAAAAPRQGQRQQLLRSFCDTPARGGTQRWEQLFRERRSGGARRGADRGLRHFFYDAAAPPPGQAQAAAAAVAAGGAARWRRCRAEPQLHCVEFSGPQLQRFLHAQQRGAGDEGDATAGFLLRSDVGGWLLLLTAHVPVVRVAAAGGADGAGASFTRRPFAEEPRSASGGRRPSVVLRAAAGPPPAPLSRRVSFSADVAASLAAAGRASPARARGRGHDLVHEAQIERRVGGIAADRDGLAQRMQQLLDALRGHFAGGGAAGDAAGGSAAAQLLGRSAAQATSHAATRSGGGGAVVEKERRLALAAELAAALQRVLDDQRALAKRAEAAEEQGRELALRLRQSLAAQSDAQATLTQALRAVSALCAALPHQAQHRGQLLQLAEPAAGDGSLAAQRRALQALAADLRTLALQTVALRVAQSLLAAADALGGLHGALVDRLRLLALHMATLTFDADAAASAAALAASFDDFASRLLRLLALHLAAADGDAAAVAAAESAFRADAALADHDAAVSATGATDAADGSVRAVELAVHWHVDGVALYRLVATRQRRRDASRRGGAAGGDWASGEALLDALARRGVFVADLFLVPLRSDAPRAQAAAEEVRYEPQRDAALQHTLLMLPIETTAAALAHGAAPAGAAAAEATTATTARARHRSSLLALPAAGRSGAASSSSSSAAAAAAFDLFATLGVHLSDAFCVQVAAAASTLLRGRAAFFPLSGDAAAWDGEVGRGLGAFGCAHGEPLAIAAPPPRHCARLCRRLRRLARQQRSDGRDFSVCAAATSLFAATASSAAAAAAAPLEPLHLLVSLLPLREPPAAEDGAPPGDARGARRPRFCVCVVEIARAVGGVDAVAMGFLVHLVNNHLHVHAAEAAQSRRETQLRSLAGSLADSSRQLLRQSETAQALGGLWRRLQAARARYDAADADADAATDAAAATAAAAATQHATRDWLATGGELAALLCPQHATLQQQATLRTLSAAGRRAGAGVGVRGRLLAVDAADVAAVAARTDGAAAGDFAALLRRCVLRRGGEGVAVAWQRAGDGRAVVSASQFVDAARGAATVVRAEAFCAALAVARRCVVVDDLPRAADAEAAQALEALESLGAARAAADGVAASRWALALRFDSGADRDACVSALNAASRRGRAPSAAAQSRRPVGGLERLYGDAEGDAEGDAAYDAVDDEGGAASDPCRPWLRRQALGGLALALRETLSAQRRRLLGAVAQARADGAARLRRLLQLAATAADRAAAFASRLQLLCAAPEQCAALLLPLRPATEPVAFAALLLHELLGGDADADADGGAGAASGATAAAVHWPLAGGWRECRVARRQAAGAPRAATQWPGEATGDEARDERLVTRRGDGAAVDDAYATLGASSLPTPQLAALGDGASTSDATLRRLGAALAVRCAAGGDVRVLVSLALPDELLSLAQLRHNASDEAGAFAGVRRCVVELQLSDGAGAGCAALRATDEALDAATRQLQTALGRLLFEQPLRLWRDVVAAERAEALTEGKSARQLLARFVRLLAAALRPLGCTSLALLVRDAVDAASLRSPSPSRGGRLSASALRATSRGASPERGAARRFDFSPSPAQTTAAAEAAAEAAFVVESRFDCEEVSGVLRLGFARACPVLDAAASAEAWALAEALTSPLASPGPSAPLETPSQRLGDSAAPGASHHHVRFAQQTLSGAGAGAAGRQGCEEVLETVGRALARRVFELHRGAKNQRRMREKQAALSQATAQLQATHQQVETLEATQSLTLHELRDRSAEAERAKGALLAEQKALKEALAQKKEMNAHLQRTLAELRREADKKEALLARQVKELKDRLAAIEQDRGRDQRELSKAQQKEFAASLQKTEAARQLTELGRAFAAAEQTIKSLRADVATLEQRERGLAESGDLRLRGFLQRIRALEEELAAARGTNAFLKKQVEAANLQARALQEQSGRRLESLQSTLHKSLSLQNLQLQTTLASASRTSAGQLQSPAGARPDGADVAQLDTRDEGDEGSLDADDVALDADGDLPGDALGAAVATAAATGGRRSFYERK